MVTSEKPVAILYEHLTWSEPLFSELERRAIPFQKLYLRDHWYDPASRQCPSSLVVNRVSAYPSGGTHHNVVLYVKQYLAYLESIGAEVVNGHYSYLVGTSKAAQLDIFERLGLCYPRARVIHHPTHALEAAAGLAFPLIAKPNIGGSGAGILKFEDLSELEQAVKTGALDFGIDGTLLIQEYLRANGNCIVRVEILDGDFLYALRLPIADGSFNYCPADGCNVKDPVLAAQAYMPPTEVIDAVKQVLAASRADLGSVEYLVSEADGRAYYYDVNPLSNFVADAAGVIGFDPFAVFVDYIVDRAFSRRA